MKPLPSSVTGVPPSTTPRGGCTVDTAASGRYVYSTPLVLYCWPLCDNPSGVEIATLDAGATHSSCLELTKRAMLVMPAPPSRQRNVADSGKGVPCTVSRVPPDTGPEDGSTALTTSLACTKKLLPLSSTAE